MSVIDSRHFHLNLFLSGTACNGCLMHHFVDPCMVQSVLQHLYREGQLCVMQCASTIAVTTVMKTF